MVQGEMEPLKAVYYKPVRESCILVMCKICKITSLPIVS